MNTAPNARANTTEIFLSLRKGVKRNSVTAFKVTIMQGLFCSTRGHKRCTERRRKFSPGIDRVSPGLPWFTTSITFRITPRNKNLYDLTSLSIHFIPPARRRPFRTYIIMVLPQPRVLPMPPPPICSPRPSPRLFLRNNLRQERRIMGHDRFNSRTIARFPFTA